MSLTTIGSILACNGESHLCCSHNFTPIERKILYVSGGIGRRYKLSLGADDSRWKPIQVGYRRTNKSQEHKLFKFHHAWVTIRVRECFAMAKAVERHRKIPPRQIPALHKESCA